MKTGGAGAGAGATGVSAAVSVGVSVGVSGVVIVSSLLTDVVRDAMASEVEGLEARMEAGERDGCPLLSGRHRSG